MLGTFIINNYPSFQDICTAGRMSAINAFEIMDGEATSFHALKLGMVSKRLRNSALQRVMIRDG